VQRGEAVDVLLVGGGVATARCARTLRRNGFAGTILLVGAEDALPYNRPPLSKELLRDDLPDELVLAEPAAWYERRGVAVRRGLTIVSLDMERREATAADGSRVGFERCLLATGAEPRRLPIDGAEHALLLRTLPDSRALRAAALRAGAGAPVTVIGGGFIGVEVASALAALGLRPTVVEAAGELWGGQLGAALSSWAQERLREAGVAVRLGSSVTRLERDVAWLGDERFGHAFAVAGIGVRPRVELAEGGGIVVADGIVTDAAQRTSHPAAWAAGDVALVDGRRVEHWHAAREAGERAGLSMLGLDAPAPRVPWLFSEVGGVTLDVIGAATDWDEERWMRPGSVLAYLAGGRVVQLAIIGSVLGADAARALVGAEVSAAELDDALGA
jgi:3-phenylpropionate/trans-cinnamate dioxygenase ferredoxin reductase subunit